MNSISISYEIKETDKEENNLKKEFKDNALANFGKLILDKVIEGNQLIISSINTMETEITTTEDVLGINDETGKEEVLKKSIKKPVYNVSAQIQIIKMKVNEKTKCVRTKDPRVNISNGEITVENINNKNEIQNSK